MNNESALTSAHATFLSDGGQMGERMRSFDWRSHPLGDPDLWPQSLRSALSICLNTTFPIGIYWGPDAHLMYNDAWAPILGNKHPWGLGRPGSEVWSEIWDVVGPVFDRVMSTGKGEFSSDALLLMERHGYVEECYFDYTFSPIRGETGRIEGVFNAVNETTHRVIEKRRLRTLRDLAADPRGIQDLSETIARIIDTLDSNPIDVPFALLYLVDKDGETATLAGATSTVPDELRSETCVLEGESPGCVWPIARALQEGGEILIGTSELPDLPGGYWDQSPDQVLIQTVASAGQERPAAVLVAGVNPRRALDDEHRAFFTLLASHTAAALTDATAYEEEKRRSESLAALDRAKTAFFSNISHELRTPLTLLLGPLQDALTQTHGELPAAAEEDLKVAQKNAQRLQKLVNSILDFSRLEAGRLNAHYQPTDLALLTSQIASAFESAVVKTGVEFIIDCSQLNQPVYVDHDLWEKIVLNLISNAFKYTRQGEIRITLEEDESGVIFRAADTGTGIPEAAMPRLFERFFRVEGVEGRSHEGTGIGLALVAELVKLHGGEVSAASTQGEGSTFTVRLPLGHRHLPEEQVVHDADDQVILRSASGFVQEAESWIVPDSIHSSQPDDDDQRVSASVLLVEDNADMRGYLSRILSSRHRVTAVGNGEEALKVIENEQPDLVVTDVMMPKLDGFGLLRALRENEETASLPVIMLSARAGEEAKIEGLQSGADDYLVKPFSARELMARIDAQVQLTGVRRETEAIARESETRIRSIIESISDAFTAVDRDWRITYANHVALEHAGRDRESVVGHVLWDAFPELEGTPLAESFHRAMNGESHRCEMQDPFSGRWLDISFHANPDGVTAISREITDQKQAAAEREELLARETRARREAEALSDAARSLTAGLDVEKTVQLAMDKATEHTGAAFGAFFYNVINEQGESFMLYTLSGASRSDFSQFPMPRNTCIFAPTFKGEGVVRSDDIKEDPRYGKNAPYTGMPEGHLPVSSYLAVPVISRSGEVLGGIFLGHPDKGVLDESAERLAVGIASQAAIAIDNASLYVASQKEIESRTRTQAVQADHMEALRLIAEDAPVGEVLERLVRMIETHSRSGVIGSILLMDPDGKHLRHGAGPSLSERYCEAIDGIRIGPSVGSCGSAAATDEPVMVTDIEHDPRWADFKALALEEGLRACWSTPVHAGNGDILGTFAMYYREPREPDQEDLNLVELASKTMAIAIERRRAEAHRREFFNLSQTMLVEAGYDGMLRRVNNAWEQILKWTSEELTSEPWIAFVHPDDQEAAAKAQDMLSEGKQVVNQDLRFEHHDGSYRWLRWNLSPVPEQNAILGVVQEITEQKQAEEALSRSEARFRALVTTSADAIFNMSPDWSVMYRLEGREFIENSDQQSGSWVETYVHPDDRATIRAAIAKAVEEKSPFQMEHRVKGQSGAYGWVLFRAIPLLDQKGDIVEWFGAASDVTRRKQEEKRNQFLVALDDTVRPLVDPHEITLAAAKLLGEHLQVDRCSYADVEDDQDTMNLTGNYTRGPHVKSIIGRHKFSDYGEEVYSLMRRNENFVVHNIQNHEPQLADIRPYLELQIQAVICTPLHKRGKLVAALSVQSMTPRQWQDDEIELVQIVAARCWESIERAKVSRTLRESESRLRLAQRAGNVGVFEWNIPENYIVWSPELKALYGMPPDSFDGGIEDWQARVVPEDAEQVLKSIKACFDQQRQDLSYEFRAVLKTGEERWLAGQAQFFYDKKCKPLRMIGVNIDIHERKRAEQAVRESEEKFRTFTETAPAMLWVTDPEGKCTFLSRGWYEYTGQTEEHALGTGWTQAAHPDDQEKTAKAFIEANSEQRQSFSIEYRLRRADGEYRWAMDIGRARFADDGTFLGYVGNVIDIHEQKLTADELARHREHLQQMVEERTAELEFSHRQLRLSERMAALGTLSAGLGHDMGNLLVPIRVRLDSLAKAELPDPLRKDVEAIRTSAEYLRKLSTGLRQLSLDPTKRSPSESIELRSWWDETELMLRNALPQGIKLISRKPAEKCWVKISRPGLTQALFNLVQNAGDAMREHGSGEVTIFAENTDGTVTISVKDNGPGMSPEVKARCLEPFFTTKARGISTGMGLALVYSLIRDAGGDITVESEEGLGTTFTLTLPAGRKSNFDQDDSVHRSAKVFVRNARLRAIATSELKSLGFEILAGEDQEPADVLILDEHSWNDHADDTAAIVLLGDEPESTRRSVHTTGKRPTPNAIKAALRQAIESTNGSTSS